MSESHHAYAYYGTDCSVLPAAVQEPSTDVLHVVVDRLGVAESRTLKQRAYSRPVAGARKSLVLIFSSATIEAQSALLKLLEEPPADVVLYLVVPHKEVLLDTVQSRLVDMSDAATTNSADWEQLRTQPIATQLSTIAEKAKNKDTAWQQSVITATIHDEAVPAHTRSLLDTYARLPGASRKMLLEELVLTVAHAA